MCATLTMPMKYTAHTGFSTSCSEIMAMVMATVSSSRVAVWVRRSPPW